MAEQPPTDATPTSPLSKPSIQQAAYGSFGSSSNSAQEDNESIEEQPRPGYSFPHQHRIIPPSITGHGRLIIAHRTVPYWIGMIVVVGATAWAVWCAVYLYRVLGGRRIAGL